LEAADHALQHRLECCQRLALKADRHLSQSCPQLSLTILGILFHVFRHAEMSVMSRRTPHDYDAVLYLSRRQEESADLPLLHWQPLMMWSTLCAEPSDRLALKKSVS
jgi:hypothetical protein